MQRQPTEGTGTAPRTSQENEVKAKEEGQSRRPKCRHDAKQKATNGKDWCDDEYCLHYLCRGDGVRMGEVSDKTKDEERATKQSG